MPIRAIALSDVGRRRLGRRLPRAAAPLRSHEAEVVHPRRRSPAGPGRRRGRRLRVRLVARRRDRARRHGRRGRRGRHECRARRARSIAASCARRSSGRSRSVHAGQRFSLSAQDAGVHADVAGWSTRRSPRAATATIISRVARDLTGGEENAQVPAAGHLRPERDRRRSSSAWATGSTARRATPRSTSPRSSQGQGAQGHAGQGRPCCASALAQALTVPGRRPRGQGARADHAARRSPRRSSPTSTRVLLIADRTNFKLRLYKQLQLVKEYTVAVGADRLRHPGRALPHPEQAGRPDLERARTAPGPATWPASRSRRGPTTRSRRAGWGSSTAPASTAPTRPTRSGTPPRTAASGWRSRT